MAIFITLQLFQKRGSNYVEPQLVFFIADDVKEAKAKSLRQVIENYPTSSGYFNHAISLGEISIEEAERILLNARTGEEIKGKKVKVFD